LHESRIDGLFVRDIFRTYGRFSRCFEVVDIRDDLARSNGAEVTILDRFAMFAMLMFEGMSYEKLVRRLEGIRNLVFLTSDLHEWSIFPDAISRIRGRRRFDPSLNRYDRLMAMFDRLDIRYLITSYECPELREIRRLRPSLSTFVVDLHVNTSIFRDYGLPKVDDLIIYGAANREGYPFRHRLSRLLGRRFKVLRVAPDKSSSYDEDICGEGLARKICASWLGLATTEQFDYLVGKYFEIPACRTVVLGNMNAQGHAIFGDHYIHVDDRMTDREIVEIVRSALADRNRLKRCADRMYDVIHGGYSLEDNERKLFEVVEKIRARCARP
jgi:hypothetical protein